MPRALIVLAAPLVAFILWGVHASMAYDQTLLAAEPSELSAPRIPVSAAFNMPDAPASTVPVNRLPATSAAKADPGTAEAPTDWMTEYYKHPAPERVPAAIAAFVAGRWRRSVASVRTRLHQCRLRTKSRQGCRLVARSRQIFRAAAQADAASGLAIRHAEARAFLAGVGRERLIADFGGDPLAQRPVARRPHGRPARRPRLLLGPIFRERPRTAGAPDHVGPAMAGRTAGRQSDHRCTARHGCAVVACRCLNSLAAHAARDFRVLDICRAEAATATSQSRDYLERVVAIAQTPMMPAR